uniref:Uncharacterized protein n=1 Tax=viral metagenome TaxID=1070528 RepID=A0A6C0ED51_9ZZZZ
MYVDSSLSNSKFNINSNGLPQPYIKSFLINLSQFALFKCRLICLHP